MKIRDRLLMTAGSCIILILIFSLMVYVSFNRVAEENERELIAQEIGHTVSELDIVMYDYLTYREERMTQQWISKYNISLEIIEKVEHKELERIKTNYADLKNLFSQITANYEKGDSSELEERLVAQFMIKSHTIIFDSSKIAKEAYNNAIEAQRTANSSMVIALAVLSWVSPDPSLERTDLFLFGYHFIEDWFGPRFIRLVSEFIINAARAAEQWRTLRGAICIRVTTMVIGMGVHDEETSLG